jgi:hypothetical protein
VSDSVPLVSTENHSIICPTCRDSWPYANKKDAKEFAFHHLTDTGHSVVLYSEYTEPIHPESIAKAQGKGILEI